MLVAFDRRICNLMNASDMWKVNRVLAVVAAISVIICASYIYYLLFVA